MIIEEETRICKQRKIRKELADQRIDIDSDQLINSKRDKAINSLNGMRVQKQT